MDGLFVGLELVGAAVGTIEGGSVGGVFVGIGVGSGPEVGSNTQKSVRLISCSPPKHPGTATPGFL